jgi:hypothetical protein
MRGPMVAHVDRWIMRAEKRRKGIGLPALRYMVNATDLATNGVICVKSNQTGNRERKAKMVRAANARTNAGAKSMMMIGRFSRPHR